MIRDNPPSWETFIRLGIEDDPLQQRAIAALIWLRMQLGESWIRRQWGQQGWLPELISSGRQEAAAAVNAVVFVKDLRAAADEVSFAEVMRNLRRGVSRADFVHAWLRAETARVFDDHGVVTFEPPIAGSRKKADVHVCLGSGETFLVETTSVFRADDDIEWQQYDAGLSSLLIDIQRTVGVSCRVDLVDHCDSQDTELLLVDVRAAAESVRADGRSRTVTSAVGWVEIEVTQEPLPVLGRFSGAPYIRDGIRRVRRCLARKAFQSTGKTPVWIRLDLRDGFFIFTNWSKLSWEDRVARFGAVVRDELKGVGHVHGVVISSGISRALGAVDPDVESADGTVGSDRGIRRLIAPHTARETVIVSLRDSAANTAAMWADAYDSEPVYFVE